MRPLLAFSKLSPNASRSDALIVTLGSRRIFAALLPSAKNRQPAASSSLLILMRAVWADTIVEDANLTVAISQLRKAFGRESDPDEFIQTISRVGYRFVAELREVAEEIAPLIVEKRIQEEFSENRVASKYMALYKSVYEYSDKITLDLA